MSTPFPKVSDIFEQRFELLEILGTGGIGTVFKARQLDADRIVAVKILHPSMASNYEFRQRFMREGLALSKIDNAHVVTVYHLGLSNDEIPYLVMEAIDAPTLRQVIANEGGMPPKRCLHIAKQICEALIDVHEAGIVHRDLKPENVFLLAQPVADFVKIIDFGLAKMDEAATQQKLTHTGELVGSVFYMSPEQCMGKKSDNRSDIYALSACIHEMLTGVQLFEADTNVGVLYKHINDKAPELAAHNVKDFQPCINTLVKKGLQKKPSSRYANASEMLSEINRVTDILAGGNTIHSSKGFQILSKHRRTIAMAIGVAATGCIATCAVTQLKPKPQSAEKAIAKKKSQPNLTSPSARAQRLLQTAKGNASEAGIAAAKEAYEIVRKNKSTIKLSLYTEATKALAKSYEINKNYAKALETLQEILLSKNPEEHCDPPREYKLFQAMAAYYYYCLGKKREAIALLETIAGSEGGNDQDLMTYSAMVAIKGKRTDILDRLVPFCTNVHCCLGTSSLCRKYKEFDLAKKFTKQAKKMKTTSLFQSTDLDRTELQIQVQECRTEVAEGKLEQAKAHLLALLKNPIFSTKLTMVHEAVPMGVALKEAGMYKEAAALLDQPLAKDELADILRAELFALEGHYDLARQRFPKRFWHVALSLDSVSGKHMTPMEMMQKMEEGKVDSKKIVLREWE